MHIEISLKGFKIRWHQRDINFCRHKFRTKLNPEAENNLEVCVQEKHSCRQERIAKVMFP